MLLYLGIRKIYVFIDFTEFIEIFRNLFKFYVDIFYVNIFIYLFLILLFLILDLWI